jgi:hypothetical protein
MHIIVMIFLETLRISDGNLAKVLICNIGAQPSVACSLHML